MKKIFEKLKKIFDPLHDDRVAYKLAISNLRSRDEFIYYCWANDIDNYVKALIKLNFSFDFLKNWFLFVGITYVLVYYGVLPV